MSDRLGDRDLRRRWTKEQLKSFFGTLPLRKVVVQAKAAEQSTAQTLWNGSLVFH